MTQSEQIQFENLAEFDQAASQLLEMVSAARLVKKTDRELTQLIKTDNLAMLNTFPEHADLLALLLEAERLGAPAEHPQLEELASLKEEAAPLLEELTQKVQEGLKKTKAREYLIKVYKLGIALPQVADLQNALTRTVKRSRKPKQTSKVAIGHLAEQLQNLDSLQLDKTSKNRIEKHKEVLASLAENYEQIDEVELQDIDIVEIEGWFTAVKKSGLEVTGLEKLSQKLRLYNVVEGVSTRIYRGKDMVPESEGVLQTASIAVEYALVHGLKDRDFKELKKLVKEAQEICTELDYSDVQLESLIGRIGQLEWVQAGQAALKKKSTKKEELESLVKQAPKELKSGELFSNIVMRSTGKKILSSDTDIHARLVELFDETDLQDKAKDIRTLVEECRSVWPSGKADRMLSTLVNVLEMFEEKNFDRCETAVEQMFQLKFYNTATFQRLEEVQALTEKVIKLKGTVEANRNKLRRSLEAIKLKEVPPFDVLGTLSRMEVTEASKIKASILSIYAEIGGDAQKDTERLTTAISEAETFKKSLAAFQKKYPLQDLTQGLQTEKLLELMTSFKELVTSYLEVEFSVEKIDTEITQYSWVIKGLNLIDGKEQISGVINKSKNLNTWQKVLTQIEASGKYGDSKLANLMRRKISEARNFDKKVKDLRTNSGKNKNRIGGASSGGLSLKLSEAELMLKDVQEKLHEFDLGSNKSYLEGLVSQVNERLQTCREAEAEASMTLKQLEAHLDFFRKTPLDLQLEMASLLEKEVKAAVFVKRIRELSPQKFLREREDIAEEYSALGVTIQEWEDLKHRIQLEEDAISSITEALEKGVATFEEANELKDKYKLEVNFLKDLKLETRVITTFLHILKQEYDVKKGQQQQKQQGKDSSKTSSSKRRTMEDAEVRSDDQETNPNGTLLDFIVLSSLAKYVDGLVIQLKTARESHKLQLMSLQEGAVFISELFNDVKRYLEFNIFGLDLATLSNSPPLDHFKNFVDLTGPIMDYKINLEIQEKDKISMHRRLFPKKELRKGGPTGPPPRPTGGSIFSGESRYMSRLAARKQSSSSKIYSPGSKHPSNKQSQDKEGAEGDSALGDIPIRKKTGRYGALQSSEKSNSKPQVSRTTISQELRDYYTKSWKKLMEDNKHLDISGLDVLMASRSLEKAIYDRIKNSPLDYDVLCTSITNTLKHIIGLKNISTHLRNENFKPNILLLYCDKPVVHLRTLDRNLSRNDGSQHHHNSGGRHHVPSRRMQQAGLNPNLLPQQAQAKKKMGMSANRKFQGFMAAKEAAAGTGYKNNAKNGLDDRVEEVSYKHYRIFSGKLNFELNDETSKTLDQVDIISCSSYDRISKFAQVPRKINLKTTVSQNEFAQYISYVINNPKQYLLLTGWVSYSKTHSKAAIYCKKNGCVASMQYSKTCKVFIFPLEALDARWLTQIPIYTTSAKIELLAMLVYKTRAGVPDNAIVPEPQPIVTPNAYRVIPTPGQGKIALKPSNLDRIKERTKIAITGRFDDIPQKYSDKSAKAKPAKQLNKLQYLLDHADDIERVPDELIEEENKIREQHAFGIKEKDYPLTGNTYIGGNLISSLKNENVSLGMDTLLRKRPVLEDRSNYFEDESANFGLGGIDKKEFIKNAVNSIQLPPSHYFLNSRGFTNQPSSSIKWTKFRQAIFLINELSNIQSLK